MPCALEGINGAGLKKGGGGGRSGCRLQLAPNSPKANRCKQAKSDGSLFSLGYWRVLAGRPMLVKSQGWASLLVLRWEYSQMDGRQVPLVGCCNGWLPFFSRCSFAILPVVVVVAVGVVEYCNLTVTA